MSARFPGLSEPTLFAMPIERAPSIVASSSTRRAVSLNSLSLFPFSIFWMNFMIPNMSALPVSSTVSTESPTGMPAASRFAVCGEPEADAQLAGWRQADRGSRRLNRRDLVRRQHDTMDDLHVVGEQPCFSNRIDLTGGGPRAAGVDRDRQTEPAGAFDLGLVDFRGNGGCRIIAAHATPGESQRDQAVIGIVPPILLSCSRSAIAMR